MSMYDVHTHEFPNLKIEKCRIEKHMTCSLPKGRIVFLWNPRLNGACPPENITFGQIVSLIA